MKNIYAEFLPDGPCSVCNPMNSHCEQCHWGYRSKENIMKEYIEQYYLAHSGIKPEDITEQEKNQKKLVDYVNSATYTEETPIDDKDAEIIRLKQELARTKDLLRDMMNICKKYIDWN